MLPENLSPFRRREQLELQKVLLDLGDEHCSSRVQSFLSSECRNTMLVGGLGGECLWDCAEAQGLDIAEILFFITVAWPGLTLRSYTQTIILDTFRYFWHRIGRGS